MENKRVALQVINESPNIVYVADIETYELHYMNAAALEMFALSSLDELYGRKCYEVIEGRDSPCAYCSNHVLNFDVVHEHEIYNRLLDKHFLYLDKALYLNRKMRITIATDITDTVVRRQETESLLRCVQTLYAQERPEESIVKLLQIMTEFYGATRGFIFSISECRTILSCVYEWCAVGIEAHGEVFQHIPVHSIQVLLKSVDKYGKIYAPSCSRKFFNADLRTMHEIYNVESVMLAALRNKDGTFLGFIGLDNPSFEKSASGLIHSVSNFVSDFLEKTVLIDKLNQLSYEDGLTKLRNRNSYAALLERFELETPQSLGIMYLDINGLKEVNDKQGHAEGDKLILSMARVLLAVFGKDAYRLGGDEFIVMQENVSQEEFQNRAKELHARVDEVTELSVSTGVIWNENCQNVAQQIEQADNLMYNTKLQYYKNNSQNAKYRTILLNSLRADIESEKFFVVLQPQFYLHDRSLGGAEALIRKRGLADTMESPTEFIPLYEKLEIIHYLDTFVFESICKALHRWRDNGYDPDLSISVNISRCTLQQEGIVQSFREICAKYDIHPRRIIIEITETIEGDNMQHMNEIIEKFANEDFLISLDDFGSGYSSLLTLADSRFDEVKIDRGFIMNVDRSDRAFIVAKNMVRMCHDLGILETVAEGIESEDLYERLKEMRCTKGQGYLFDKPLTIEDFERKYIFPNSVTQDVPPTTPPDAEHIAS